MIQCMYELVCPFYQHRIPIHDTMYRTNVKRYCEASQESCAIHQVMQKTSFLSVPPDLYPNQTFRVPEILKK